MSEYFLYLIQLFLANRSIQHDWYIDWFVLMVALGKVVPLVSIVLVVVTWVARIIAEVLFIFVLLVIWFVILTFVIWISNMCLIDFDFILT